MKLSGGIRPYLRGTGIQHLTGESLHQLSLPLPPLPEQQRIVAILDEAFAAIANAKANAEKNLQNTRALFDSHAQAILGQHELEWQTATIEQCFSVRSGDFLPAKLMATGGTIAVYGGNGITGMHDRSNLSGDNILIGRVGAKCGNVRKVSGNLWVTDNAFFVTKLKAEFDLDFLAFLLGRMNLRGTANQAAQPVISYSTIKSIALTYPHSVLAQRAIVSQLHDLYAETLRLESIYRRKLAALDELKKSLLHRAFNGDL